MSVASTSPDTETSYCIGSYNSATATDSNVPGPGRLLGKAYGFFGRKFENGLSYASRKLGYATQVETEMQPQTPTSDPTSADGESVYCISLTHSSTETGSDVPGPGRLLGKAYGVFGRKVESGLTMAALKLGYGPRATAVKIRRLVQGGAPVKINDNKKLNKAGKKLLKYVR